MAFIARRIMVDMDGGIRNGAAVLGSLSTWIGMPMTVCG